MDILKHLLSLLPKHIIIRVPNTIPSSLLPSNIVPQLYSLQGSMRELLISIQQSGHSAVCRSLTLFDFDFTLAQVFFDSCPYLTHLKLLYLDEKEDIMEKFEVFDFLSQLRLTSLEIVSPFTSLNIDGLKKYLTKVRFLRELTLHVANEQTALATASRHAIIRRLSHLYMSSTTDMCNLFNMTLSLNTLNAPYHSVKNCALPQSIKCLSLRDLPQNPDLSFFSSLQLTSLSLFGYGYFSQLEFSIVPFQISHLELVNIQLSSRTVANIPVFFPFLTDLTLLLKARSPYIVYPQYGCSLLDVISGSKHLKYLKLCGLDLIAEDCLVPFSKLDSLVIEDCMNWSSFLYGLLPSCLSLTSLEVMYPPNAKEYCSESMLALVENLKHLRKLVLLVPPEPQLHLQDVLQEISETNHALSWRILS
ncbi:hypothetical protein RCL1_000923 [Eukaryota sp. TZLM3-RCL]